MTTKVILKPLVTKKVRPNLTVEFIEFYKKLPRGSIVQVMDNLDKLYYFMKFTQRHMMLLGNTAWRSVDEGSFVLYSFNKREQPCLSCNDREKEFPVIKYTLCDAQIVVNNLVEDVKDSL